jgi:hypothetical protein
VRRIAAAVLALAFVAAAAGAPDALPVARFSALAAGGELVHWKPLTFPKIESHTRYALVHDGGATVVRADADASASGLVRELEVDLAAFPVLAWRWKVAGVLERGDVTRKSGDDYPARVYVTFAFDPERLSLFERAGFEAAKLVYGEYPPTAALSYIWESRAPVGRVVPNPYTSRVQMIVVESGDAKAGTWVDERRNLLDDYRRAFGEDPPKVSGVAIMTDTDNTGETATAWYGDISFLGEHR